MNTPQEAAYRKAERAVKTRHPVGGGVCSCGHTWACHWPNGCIRHGCDCQKRPGAAEARAPK